MNTLSSSPPTLVERRGLLHHTDWAAALTAGVTAGISYVAAVSLFGLDTNHGMWGPAHRIAAIALGPDALTSALEFPPKVVVVAVAFHLTLSAIYGVLIGWLVHRLHTVAALAVGVAFALVAIFGLNFYLVAPALFPWFVEVRNLPTALAHALFGLIVAGTYVALRLARPGPTRVWRQGPFSHANLKQGGEQP